MDRAIRYLFYAATSFPLLYIVWRGIPQKGAYDDFLLANQAVIVWSVSFAMAFVPALFIAAAVLSFVVALARWIWNVWK